MGLTDDQRRLLEDLRAVHEHLRDETRERYGRINPFTEDLSDWRERGRYWTGEDRGITIYDSTTVVGDVEIGEGTWIGPFCSLDGTGGLRIGAWCSISNGVQLFTHDTVRWALSGGRAEAEHAPTTIGDRCFLGARAVVVRGVTIGDGCVVGAGAVVVDDVPSGWIVGGVPAVRLGAVEHDGGAIRLVYD
jgi:carbonic anhydrase/acetyltransferase-like protein (isoleucine patch superfamily)